jgi:hypothetical protein
MDAAGDFSVTDYNNHRIRKVTAAGIVTTIAGSGNAAFADGTGTAASFNHPYDLAIDHMGDLIVSDEVNNRVRKVTAAGAVTPPWRARAPQASPTVRALPRSSTAQLGSRSTPRTTFSSPM